MNLSKHTKKENAAMLKTQRAKIREFIEYNFLFREDATAIRDGDSLLDAGLIDSTGVLELISFLETEFGLAVSEADITPDNLDSIERIDSFVTSKIPQPIFA
jgi:acyl carrier protein